MSPNSVIKSEHINVEKKEVTKRYKTYFGLEFDQPLNTYNIFFITLYHLVFLYGVITYPWIRCWRTTVYGVVLGQIVGFGVTGGVHRYFTHKSYKATRPLQVLLLILYAAAGHNKLYDWVRDHRVHHKFSETDADPHNSKRGFFFAHVGWLMMKKHPDVTEKGKSVDMSDIANDPLLIWFDKNLTKLKLLFCFILPTLVPPLCWGETWWNSIMSNCVLRYILLLNGTWLVNSAAHLYGNQPYDTNMNPRECWIVSFLSSGEGWHNYHHCFPWDYKASEYGKLNLTTVFLDIFGKLGWAYDFKTASPELVKRVATKFGDGTHIKFGRTFKEDGNVDMAKNL